MRMLRTLMLLVAGLAMTTPALSQHYVDQDGRPADAAHGMTVESYLHARARANDARVAQEMGMEGDPQDVLPVVDVRPVWFRQETQSYQCKRVRVGSGVGGLVAGSALGGLVGHQIGGGRGRVLATVLGGVVGGGVGQRVASTRQICGMMPDSHMVSAYAVAVRDGQSIRTVISEVSPGATLSRAALARDTPFDPTSNYRISD